MALINPLSTDSELKSLVNIALQMTNSGHPAVRTTDNAATLLYYIALDLAASLSGNVTQSQLNKEISDRSIADQDISRVLIPHANNSDSHITAVERQKWNGLTSAYVFADTATMNAWIAANKTTLQIGNLLYIQDANGTCYWWDGATARVRPSSTIINDFYTKGQIDSLIALASRDVQGSRFFKDTPKDGNVTLIELAPGDGQPMPAAIKEGLEIRFLARALYADSYGASPVSVKISFGALGTYPLYTSQDGQGIARGAILPGQVYTATFVGGSFVLTDADVGVGRIEISTADSANGVLDLRKNANAQYFVCDISGEIKEIRMYPGSLATLFFTNPCYLSPVTGKTEISNGGRALYLKASDRILVVGTIDGYARLVNYQRLATGIYAESGYGNEVILNEEQLFVHLETDRDGTTLDKIVSFGVNPARVHGSTRVDKTNMKGPHVGYQVTPDGIECGQESAYGGIPAIAFNSKFFHAVPNANYISEKAGLPPGAFGVSIRNGAPCFVWNDNGILKYSGANLAWTTL